MTIAPTPTKVLFPFGIGFGIRGVNFIEVPGTSPVNESPSDPSANGFKALCTIFGLTGTKSVISQFNARDGVITTHMCNQAKAPPFQPCQGVLILPEPVAPSFAGQIPFDANGHEATWIYTTYGGTGNFGYQNLFGIPHTSSVTDMSQLCGLLNLPAVSTIWKSFPDRGVACAYQCGQPPPPPECALTAGEAVRIQSTASTPVTGMVPIP